jgi:WD40 repeat protein
MKVVAGPRWTGQPLRFSGDGRTLVAFRQSAGASADLLRWSVPNLQPRETTTLPESGQPLVVPTLSDEGRWFAAGVGPGQAVLWDLSAPGKMTRLTVDCPGRVMALEFSPDGAQLAASFMDSTAIYLWDLTTSPVQSELRGHRGYVRSLVYSADGRTLFSADTDKFIKVWDTTERKETGMLLGHRSGIASLDLSPDGRTVASTSSDQTLRLWNVATRREVARFETEGEGRTIVFSPDGSALLVSTQKDNSPNVKVWRAPTLSEADAPPVATK